MKASKLSWSPACPASARLPRWACWLAGLLGILLPGLTQAQPAPLVPDVTLRRLMTVGNNTIRVEKDPRDHVLYYLKRNGSIWRVTLNAGVDTSTSVQVHAAADHGISNPLGFEIGPDGTMYVMGNQDVGSNQTRMRLARGVPNGSGGRTWSLLAETVAYPRSNTAFDHYWAGLLVTADGQHLIATSGSRTDHGNIESSSGAFPNTREVPLTAIAVKLPLNVTNTLVLQNDRDWLVSQGYLFAEGLRNTFDLAYGPNGDLFGTENGPDADYPEEINWLRQGEHYGFPWRMGGFDNRTRFPGYNYATDTLWNPSWWSYNRILFEGQRFYDYDPTFPPPPPLMREAVINLGPDANSLRGPDDRTVRADPPAAVPVLYGMTPHRSPLGIVFDAAGTMAGDYTGDGFYLSWTAGNPAGDSNNGPFLDASQDLVQLDNLTRTADNQNYQAHFRRVVGGFKNPIDSEIIGHRIFVLEYGSPYGLYEVSFPQATPDVVASPTSITVPEGGTATFQVRLSLPPAGNVTVSVARTSGDTDLTVQSGASLVFTPANWNVFQTVTLAAAEDGDFANGTATFTCSAPGHNAVSVTATEADNDSPPGNTPPTLSDIANRTTLEDTPSPVIPFTVGDAETPAAALVVTAVSDNPGLIPAAGIVLGGSGANRTIQLFPALNQYGAAEITVTVSDGELTASDAFNLTVSPVNDPPTITPPGAQTAFADTVIGPLGFTVDDVDNPASLLTVTAASDNPALFPSGSLVLGGSGTARTITLTPAAGQTGTALVTLTVGDGSATASAGFSVTVTADPNLVVARRLLGGMVLDGTPDEAVWTWVAGANKPVIGSPNNDTSFAVLWDDTYLYVAARVLDAALYNDSANVWEDDSVEIYVDGNHNHGTTYDSFDRQFIKGHADSALFEKGGNLAGVLHATATIPGGYAVELAIPWANFGVAPAAGLVIGFDVGNNDDDDGAGREHQTTWRGTQNNWNNTSAFGDLRLSAETVGTANTPPTISGVPDQTLPPGGSVSGLAFTVGDAETLAGSLTVTASSSNAALLPNSALILGGSGADRTLSFTPSAGVFGTAVVTLTVSDGTLSASTSFTVTVTRGSALFIVANPAALNAADAGVRDRLLASGFTVQVVDDDATATSQADGRAIIVISSTVVSGAVNTKFRDVAVPVLNWEPALQDDFAFTGTSFGTDMGTTSGLTGLSIINAAHPLAAGLAAGTQTVTTSGQVFTWGVPVAAAQVVATEVGNPGRAMLYGIESGAALTGGRVAAARRVNLFLQDNAFAALNPAGLALFDAAVNWLLGPPGANTPPTLSALANQTIPEDGVLGPLAFTVGDAETPAGSLVVSASSGNPAVIPAAGLVLGGGGGSRTLTVTPSANAFGTAVITVSVSDGEATTSAAFTVTVTPVNDPPFLSGLSNQTINEDTVLGPLAFTVGDVETAADSLVVSASSGNPAVIPAAGLVLGGGGGSRTLTVTPAANAFGTAVITVSVSDGEATTSAAFTVTVNPVNDPPTISSLANVTVPAGGSSGPLAFTVGDVETAASALTVTAGSSNPTLLPPAGLVLGGGGASRTLTVNPAAGQSGTATVTVTVSDGALSASTSFTVTVTSGGLPPPWTATDINNPGVAGSTSHNSGVWTVAGGGSDIWGSADQFRFVHQPLSADGEIIARVTSLQNTHPWAKAGVMIRESLNGNSRHAFMGITPANGFAWQRRTATGGSSAHTAGGSLNAAPDNWVRLTRQGNTFRAFKSADGVNWTQVGSALTIGMASEIYLGLAVTSHNNGTTAAAVFDNIIVVP